MSYLKWLLLVAAFFLGLFGVVLAGSLQKLKSGEPIDSLLQPNGELLNTAQVKNLLGNDLIVQDKESAGYSVYLTLTDVRDEIIPIKLRNGKEIGKSLVTLAASYKDGSGARAEVLIPAVISTGTNTAFSPYGGLTEGEEKISQLVTYYKDLYLSNLNKELSVFVSVDLPTTWKSKLNPAGLSYQDKLLTDYYKNWSMEIYEFITQANSQLTLLPVFSINITNRQ